MTKIPVMLISKIPVMLDYNIVGSFTLKGRGLSIRWSELFAFDKGP